MVAGKRLDETHLRTAAWLLANTTSLVIATGIANIYHREPGVTLAAQFTLAEQSNDRFSTWIGSFTQTAR